MTLEKDSAFGNHYRMQRLLFLSWLTVAWTATAAEIAFNRDIRPLLSNNCIFCHGPDEAERKGDLRLDTEAGARRVIDTESPAESALILRLNHKDPDEVMPPPDSGKTLTTEERQLIQNWVAAGAPWQEHWAYVEPKVDEPETVGWIDRFLDQSLEEAGLESMSRASKSTLLRRVSFDLIGLPPTPAETEAFLLDQSLNAFEKVVDRLLESPHYGERMAVYWLDLVRYADTVGYHGDQDHNISPYRDYVIAAFNKNLSFDQFTREQLAGDLLPGSTVDQKVATGYNRLLQTSHEGGVQAKEYLAIYAADRVRNVSNVWMAATLGCAQCHDHKYDPYTARDFYTMSAFFADIDEAKHFKVGTNNLPTKRPPEIAVLSEADRLTLQQIDRDLAACERDLVSCLPAGKGKRETLIAKREALEQRRDALQNNTRLTMVTVATQPRVTRILPRGNWLDDSGEEVQPAVPAFLGQLSTEGRATRLDLANWFTNVEDGAGKLTARVFANRFWYLLFGRGLSERLDDFGGQGVPPSHPQLLDHLALAFVGSGWDIKAMMKLLVMTEAYQRSSGISKALERRDESNRLFGRQARYRLPAEMVRDSALAISGLLVNEIGGASVKPYQPTGYFRHLNFPTRKYQADKDERQWRRGVYVHWQRQFLHPMMKAFDAPSREECTAQRPRSNTPTAALTLLNDPTFVEAARVFAQRLLNELPSGDDELRINRAFLIALSRAPEAAELTLLKTLLADERTHYESHGLPKQNLLGRSLATPRQDLVTLEIAVWSAVARTLLNLHETITRS